MPSAWESSRDSAQAAGWYGRAAEQGNAHAQLSLGRMYLDGEGVPQDYTRAYGWLNLAASRFPASEQSSRDEAVEMRDLAAVPADPHTARPVPAVGAGVAAQPRAVAASTGSPRGGCLAVESPSRARTVPAERGRSRHHLGKVRGRADGMAGRGTAGPNP